MKRDGFEHKVERNLHLSSSGYQHNQYKSTSSSMVEMQHLDVTPCHA
jgi:hypothetical protein